MALNINNIDTTPINKIPTGIKGFDNMLEGGIPEHRTIIIEGGTGTGKTVLLNEFIYRGITEFNQPGVYVTFEETPVYIIKNVNNLKWNYSKLIKNNKLSFVDLSLEKNDSIVDKSGGYDLQPIIERIKYAVNKINAKRVAIDSLNNLIWQFDNIGKVRSFTHKLIKELNKLNVTTFLSIEIDPADKTSYNYGEGNVADGVVRLDLQGGEQQFIRTMFVKKLRGVSYRSGSVEFEISGKGLIIYPKLPVDLSMKKTKFSSRKKFGIKKLDKYLDGGIPEGHLLLLSGNTGAGKTILGMQFLNEGLSNGEKVVYASMEEPVFQVLKSAKNLGFPFQKYLDENKLKFVTSSLIDIRPDKLLYDIKNAIEELGAKRVLIDSISSLESATLNKDKVRQFMIQLNGYLKTKGITTICNYLLPYNFGSTGQKLLSALETNELRLSSVVDGVFLLLYSEGDKKVEKIFNILKLRGSDHYKGISNFDITNEGFEIKD